MNNRLSTVKAWLDQPIPGPQWMYRLLAGWVLPGLLGGLIPFIWAVTPPERQRPPLLVALGLGTAVAVFARRYVRVSGNAPEAGDRP